MADNSNLSSAWVQDLFDDFVDDLEVSPEMSSQVERATRGQSCNPSWSKARRVVLTASNFYDVIHMRASTAPDNKLKHLLGYKVHPSTRAMAYGLRLV